MIQDTTTDEQLMLLADESIKDTEKTEAVMDPEWEARQDEFRRQVALEKAIQVTRVAVAHRGILPNDIAGFTVASAREFLAFLQEK